MRALPFLVGSVLSLFIASCATSAPAVEFGDDAGNYTFDGECDDPRFSGAGSASTLLDEDAYHDASDCRMLFENGRIQLADARARAPRGNARRGDEIDFGDDASEWAGNGECDDPRFSGSGSARKLVRADRFHDASDCSDLFERGEIELTDTDNATRGDGLARIDVDGIDFGDDAGSYTFDDECDDPRFIGDGIAEVMAEPDRFHDATDCSILYQRGLLQLAEDQSAPAVAIGSGQARSGRLAVGSYPDRYTYQGTAGTTVVFDLQSSAFDTYLTVMTPGGERIGNDDFGNDTSRSQLKLTLSESGEYQVEVASYDTTGSGAYALTLNDLKLIADNAYDGTLESGDDTSDKGEFADTYTFEGQPGELVTLELGSDDFDTFLVLRTPDGAVQSNDDAECSSEICVNYGNTSLIERELTAAGTYTVRVTSYSADETGAYHLRISRSEANATRD
jgi:hypothetical protein